MTVTYPLTPPASPAPVRAHVEPVETVAQSRSPFSFRRQYQIHQGGHWKLSIELPVLVEAEWREWTAFITALQGVAGTFLYGDPLRAVAKGAASGSPAVSGAGNAGLVLPTAGWTASTLVLKAGDMIQLGTGADAHLHMITQDATSDGTGAASLDIWPRLRTSPADGQLIIVDSPVGVWQLAANANGWDYEAPRHGRLSINCIEAL